MALADLVATSDRGLSVWIASSCGQSRKLSAFFVMNNIELFWNISTTSASYLRTRARFLSRYRRQNRKEYREKHIKTNPSLNPICAGRGSGISYIHYETFPGSCIPVRDSPCGPCARDFSQRPNQRTDRWRRLLQLHTNAGQREQFPKFDFDFLVQLGAGSRFSPFKSDERPSAGWMGVFHSRWALL